MTDNRNDDMDFREVTDDESVDIKQRSEETSDSAGSGNSDSAGSDSTGSSGSPYRRFCYLSYQYSIHYL